MRSFSFIVCHNMCRVLTHQSYYLHAFGKQETTEHLHSCTGSSVPMHVFSRLCKINILGWLVWVSHCLVINCFPSKWDLFCNSINNDRTQKEKIYEKGWKSQWYGNLAWNYSLNKREQLMEATAAFLDLFAFLVIVENDSSLIALKTI